MHHKGLGLNSADQARIAGQLEGGKAAVGVLAKEDEAAAIQARLTELGGVAETVDVPEEAAEEADTAAPAVEEAQAEAGDDLTIIDGIGPDYAAALNAAGVKTFADLSQQTPEGIADILSKAGKPLFAGNDASSWPRQAKLAADGDWSALRRYITSTQVAAYGGSGSRSRRSNERTKRRSDSRPAALLHARVRETSRRVSG